MCIEPSGFSHIHTSLTRTHCHLHAHTRARTHTCALYMWPAPQARPIPHTPLPPNLSTPSLGPRDRPSQSHSSHAARLPTPPPNARQSRPHRHADWKTAELTTPGMCCSSIRHRNSSSNSNKSKRVQPERRKKDKKRVSAAPAPRPALLAYCRPRDVSKHTRRDR